MSRCYTQLSLADRRRLHHLVAAKVPVNEMARQLGGHRSTIYREIKRQPNGSTSVEVRSIGCCKPMVGATCSPFPNGGCYAERPRHPFPFCHQQDRAGGAQSARCARAYRAGGTPAYRANATLNALAEP
jgi:hypothetical protein